MSYLSLSEKITIMWSVANSREYKELLEDDRNTVVYAYQFNFFWDILSKYIKVENMNFKVKIINLDVADIRCLVEVKNKGRYNLSYDDCFLANVYLEYSKDMSDLDTVKFYDSFSYSYLNRCRMAVSSLPADTKMNILLLCNTMRLGISEVSTIYKRPVYKVDNTYILNTGTGIIRVDMRTHFVYSFEVIYYETENLYIIRYNGDNYAGIQVGGRLIKTDIGIDLLGYEAMSEQRLKRLQLLLEQTDIDCSYKEVNKIEY